MELTIRVRGRVCTPEYPVAAVEDDHLTDTLVFVFDGAQGGSVYLKTKIKNTPDKILLSRDPDVPEKYRCTLERQTIPEAGQLMCQIAVEKAVPENNDVTIWQSRIFTLLVEKKIDADTAIETAYPTLLQQWEAAMAGYAETVEGGGLQFVIDGDRIGLKRLSDTDYTYTDHLTGPTGTPGVNGADGREVQLQTSATHVQWKYSDAATWTDLIALALLKGADGANGADGTPGTPGADGREVQLQTSATHVQWKYSGAATWTDLIELALLKGADGADGEDFRILGYYASLSALQAAVTAPAAGDAYGVGAAAPYTIYIYDGVSLTWKDNGTIQGPQGVPGADGTPGTDGADGRQVELQTSATHVQWRYSGETAWTDLIALALLKGADGADGADGAPGADGAAGTDGREVQLQTSATHIQWKYSGAATWTDLIALALLKGADGADGAPGPNEVSATTTTALTGLLKGNGTKVTTAILNTDYAGATHASRHASGGADAVTPAAIGAVASSAVGAASGVASLDTDSKVTAAQATAAIVTVTAAITIGSTHYGRMLYCSNASAITITIPTGMPLGTEIEIYRAGAGTVTLSAAYGVTIQCSKATYGIANQYTSVCIKVVASNTVAIQGNVG